MKIAIIGCGFVGGAVLNAFSRGDNEILVVDPVHSDLTIADVNDAKPDLVFVCLPTPPKTDGSVDGSLVRDTLKALDPDLLKVVKSTITPNYLEGIPNLVFNPEFLTQRTANYDFLHPSFMIYGSDDPVLCHAVDAAFCHYSDVEMPPKENRHFTSVAEACMVKYILNCHYATKVIFMHEMARLMERMGYEWKDMKKMLASDERLGPSHLDAPGPDGYWGFGGACFPKDTKALKAYAKSWDVSTVVLGAAIARNDMIRDEPTE